MVQSNVVEVDEIEEVSEWELTEEEMDSILLPMSEESQKYMLEVYAKYKNGYKPERRTCVGVIINTETGEISYD